MRSPHIVTGSISTIDLDHQLRRDFEEFVRLGRARRWICIRGVSDDDGGLVRRLNGGRHLVEFNRSTLDVRSLRKKTPRLCYVIRSI